MTTTAQILILIVCMLAAAGAGIVWARSRRPLDSEPLHTPSVGTDVSSDLQEEVKKIRAEVRDLRARATPTTARKRERQSVFMDMADALNRLSDPPPNYDEACLEVPVMDLALGKRLKVLLPNKREVEFRLPARTKSGTKFRFRREGEDGRDLHLTVRATPEKSNGT